MTLEHIEVISLIFIAIILFVTSIVTIVFIWQSCQYKKTPEYLNTQSDENFYPILERLALLVFFLSMVYAVIQTMLDFSNLGSHEAVGILYAITIAIVSSTALM